MKVMIKPAMARPLGVRNTPITENIKPKTHRIQPSTGTQPRNNPNKAIITGDIDKQEQLGIYEVSPEDFALAEFVDSSKLELQRIVRDGLDVLRKENS